MTTPFLPRRASALVLAVFMAAGAACDRDTASRSAVRDAGERLQALAAEGRRITAGDADRRKGFENVLQTVKPYREGDGSEAAAANLMAARALAGIADIDASVASEGERRALDRAVAVRASLNLYTGQTSMAAASAFDPAESLAAIDQQLRTLDQDAAKAAADKAAATKQRDDLLARAKAALDKSKALRDQAGTLRRQAADTSAVRGLELTQQSVALARQADELDREAGYLQADADAIAPTIAEMDRKVASVANEKTATQARRAEVVKRGEFARATVAEATATAGTASSAIARQVTELASHRSGDMDAAATRANNGYREALAAAKKALGAAKGADRTSAQLVVGSIQQSWAHLAATQWRGRQAYAALLTLLAGVQPAMEGSAKFGEDAKAAQAAADEALAAAKQQYQDAIDTYSNVQGASEEVKARIERIKQILTDLNAGKFDGVPAAAPVVPSPAPAPAGGDSSAAVAPAGEAETAIRAVLDQMLASIRSKDFDALVAMTHIDGPKGRETMQSMAAVLRAGGDLEAACKSKFGKSVPAIVGDGPGSDIIGLLWLAVSLGEEEGKHQSSEYRIVVEGNKATATLTIPEVLDIPRAFVVVDGKWRLTVTQQELVTADTFAPMLKPAAAAFAALAEDVKSGKISSEEMLRSAVMQRLGQVGRRINNGPLPQPGGG